MSNGYPVKPRRMTEPEKGELEELLRAMGPSAQEIRELLRQHFLWEEVALIPAGGDFNLARDSRIVAQSLALLSRLGRHDDAVKAQEAFDRVKHKLSEGRGG